MLGLGVAIILISVALPLFWFSNEFPRDPSALASQYIGSIALILMAWSQLLATRFKIIEILFGAQDRLYVLHKWLGIVAVAAILLHDTIDAELRGAVETALSDFGETLGEISLYGILVLVTITLITFVPYRLWFWTHRFMGAFFAMSFCHFLLIPTPFGLNSPAGLYVAAFCLVGVLCYVYTLLPVGMRFNQQTYEVISVEKTGGAMALNLVPEGKGISHRAGQFAFLRFQEKGKREAHPFTISAAPKDDRSLRFTIRPLGDFTHSLQTLNLVGNKVDIEGPFGRFLPSSGKKQSIWIAGGVGVTPFVAWAEDLSGDQGQVDLYYCYRNESAAPHLEELTQLAAAKENFSLHRIETGREGRLSVDRIRDDLGSTFGGATVSFCGPESLRQALQKDFAAYGISGRKFRYEEFEIRSGINVTGIVRWILARFSRT